MPGPERPEHFAHPAEVFCSMRKFTGFSYRTKRNRISYKLPAYLLSGPVISSNDSTSEAQTILHSSYPASRFRFADPPSKM